MRVAALLIVAACASSVASAQGASLSDVFEAANLAASRGDYRRAIAGYNTLLEAGVRDPDVFFNLGTTFAQSGDYPRAILNYERSLVLRPNDEKAATNLRAAEKALEEGRAEAEGEATIERRASIGEAVYASFTEDTLALLLLFANLFFFGCLSWTWVARRRSGALVAASTGAAILLLFAAAGIGVKAGTLRDGPRAVVLGDRVPLREGPDPEARIRGEARGGDRVEVVGADDDFVKLRAVGGEEGWASVDDVGLVDPDARLH
jgi:hypothetical protein